jgi:Spy/CpxP family protein refolding chaperone
MEKPWKVIGAFIVVFIAGSVFGGMLALRVNATIATAKRPGPAQPQALGPAILRRFEERLDLTPEQQEKLRPIVDRAAEDLRRVQQNSLRESGVILRRLQQDFRKELTPPQIKKLEEIENKQRERLKDEKEFQKGGALAPLKQLTDPPPPAKR